MSCCPNHITYFANKSSTDVAYNGEYGEKPLVTVLYLQDNVWISQGVGTAIQLEYGEATNNLNSRSYPNIGVPSNNQSITNIHIDHGGPATGIVKLS